MHDLALVELANNLGEPGDVAGGAVDFLEQRRVRLDLARQAERRDRPLSLPALGRSEVGRRSAAVQLAAAVPVRGPHPAG